MSAADHFCKGCGAHVSGGTCPHCQEPGFDIDPFKIHDISPRGDGSLLKVVKVAGAAGLGPQALPTPSPLCAISCAVTRLRPDAGARALVTWPPEAVDVADLPAALRTAVETMRHGEVAHVTVVDAKADVATEYAVEVLDWDEKLECARASPGAVEKRVVTRPPHVAWREPRTLDEITIRGYLEAPCGARVDYGPLIAKTLDRPTPGETVADPSARARGWFLDEAAVTETGAPVCAGLEDALRTMRATEVADVRICAARAFSDDAAPALAGRAVSGRIQLLTLEEDEDEELMRRRGCWSGDEMDAKRVARVDALRGLGNRHLARGALDRALRRYDRALELADDDDDPPAALVKARTTVRLNRAAVYLKAGRHGDARADCDAVLAADPKNAKAMFRRARALEGLGSLDAATAAMAALGASGDAAVARDARRALVGLRATRRAHRAEEKKLFAGVYKSPPPPAGPKPDPAALALAERERKAAAIHARSVALRAEATRRAAAAVRRKRDAVLAGADPDTPAEAFLDASS